MNMCKSIEKSTLFRDNMAKYAYHIANGHPNLPILSLVSPAEYYLVTRYSYEDKLVCEGHIYPAYQLPNGGEKVIILEDGFTQHISGVSMAWHDSFFAIEKVKYFANFYNTDGNHYYQVNSYIIYDYTSLERDSLVWYDYDVYSNDDGINIRFENNTSHLQCPWCGHSIVPKTCGYYWDPILERFQKNTALDIQSLGEHLQKGLCAGLGITRDILNDSSTVSEEHYEEFLNYVTNEFMLTNDMEENIMATLNYMTDYYKKIRLEMYAPRTSKEAIECACKCLKGHDEMMDKKEELEKAELAKHRKALSAFIDSIQNVYYRDPYTIVLWKNGEKTIVKRTETDSKPYDSEFGLMACITKYLMGNRPDYYDLFRKWLPEDAKPAPRPTKAELKAAANAKKEAEEAAKQAKMEELYAEWSKSNA